MTKKKTATDSDETNIGGSSTSPTSMDNLESKQAETIQKLTDQILGLIEELEIAEQVIEELKAQLFVKTTIGAPVSINGKNYLVRGGMLTRTGRKSAIEIAADKDFVESLIKRNSTLIQEV